MNWTTARGGWLWVAVAGVLIGGAFLILLLTKLPPRYRRPLMVFLVFTSGLFYVMEFFLPTHEVTENGVTSQENILTPYTSLIVEPLAATLAASLLGLGLFSLGRIHGNNIVRKRPGWYNSLALILSAITMLIFGFWSKTDKEHAAWVDTVFDHLFNGIFQNMDAAMFSLISFFILSAAYRAFRIRNIESTILMVSGLVVLLGLSFGVLLTNWVPTEGIASNFRVETWSSWVLNIVSVPAFRAIDFGIGLGSLAMGLRIWLGIERGALFAD